jgi:hypothetical protein
MICSPNFFEGIYDRSPMHAGLCQRAGEIWLAPWWLVCFPGIGFDLPHDLA